MKRFKRLLVGLNLSDQDKFVIQAAGKITQLSESEEVHFIHITERLAIPDEIAKEYPELAEPAGKHAESVMSESIGKYFVGAPETDVTHEVLEGSQIDMLLQHMRQKDIDMVIVGRKSWEHISGHIAEKVARKAPCSVLIIPEGRDLIVGNILVGSDFSPHSKEAMDIALSFAQKSGSSKITCLHVLEYSHDKSHNGFLDLLRKAVRKDFDDFLRQFNFQGISMRSDVVVEHNVAKAIREFFWRHKIDLIVVGSRGKTAAAAVLLGSVTETLIRMTNTPLLAVKRKGETMNLLKAFFTK
jgi:nucleotide-binding universal stress UspA family protein